MYDNRRCLRGKGVWRGFVHNTPVRIGGVQVVVATLIPKRVNKTYPLSLHLGVPR